jgi:hypothetical protein
MANQPTHLEVYFARTVRVRKEHIAGSPAPEGPADLMTIVQRGDTKRIQFNAAQDLLLSETAIENKIVNRDRIEADKAEVRQITESEREAQSKTQNKKAA